MSLRKFLRTLVERIRKIIPVEIQIEEPLIRCILHPFQLSSKNKVRPIAFTPPPDSTDVSIIRLDYTNMNASKYRCKKIKIGDSKYKGVSKFIRENIEDLNNDPDLNITAEIVATPLNSKNEEVKKRPISGWWKGTPMHADIRFERPVIIGEPQTDHRLYAKKLVKSVKLYIDDNPESPAWGGQDMKHDN